jgi:hypothetical protein
MSRVTSKTGEQGVLLAVAELLERGMNPYRPVIDDHGVDLMLGDGTRIQVKSAHLSRSKRAMESRTRIYEFSCCENVYIPGSGRRLGLSWQRRMFSPECDFLLLVGLDERRFWIVPAAYVDARKNTTITLGPKAMPSALEIQKMIDQGMQQIDIACELECSETTIWKYKKWGNSRRGDSTREIRAFEDRWDLLTDPDKDRPTFNVPLIYERDPDFVATLAGPIAA